MVDKIATTNLDRCIGCGQCVIVCETKVSQLKKKDEEIELPEDAADLYMKILAQTKSKWHMFKVRLKWALGMRV